MLPPTLLGKWILVVSIAAIFNTAQCFLDPSVKLTKRVYAQQPAQVTQLMARMFGTWTALSSIIRLYGAYHLHDRTAFYMTFATFVIAFGHFTSELLIYKTTSLRSPGLLSPMIVSSLSIVWMALA